MAAMCYSARVELIWYGQLSLKHLSPGPPQKQFADPGLDNNMEEDNPDDAVTVYLPTKVQT